MAQNTVQETRIHASAIVDGSAVLGENVEVGPYAVIGPNVELGDGVRIGAHVVIERDARIGRDCRIHPGAVLAGDPQDLKFGGEVAPLIIGERTVVRECATLNRGTHARGFTKIGNDCLIMAYSHVAHDCVLGDRVILSNSVNMGGHCELGDWVIVGGLTAIHQFVQIGAHAFVSGSSAVRKDVPPFVKAAGNPLKLYGLNSVGLERRGFTLEQRTALRRAYRMLFHSKLNVTAALAAIRENMQVEEHVETLVRFIEGSHRGITIG